MTEPFSRDDNLINFLIKWYGKPDRDPGLSTFKNTPKALRTWHSLASRWSRPITFISHPIPLEKLEIQDGKLEFWFEGQGSWVWGINPGEEDSEVFDRPPGQGHEPWMPTGERLSDFLLHVTTFEAIHGAKISWWAANVTPAQLGDITKALKPLPFPDWRWPSPGTKVFAGDNVIARITTAANRIEGATTTTFDVAVAATSEAAITFFNELSGLRGRLQSKPSSMDDYSTDPVPDIFR